MKANHNAQHLMFDTQRSSGSDFDVQRFFSLLRASASPRETQKDAGDRVQCLALSVERFPIPNSSFLTPPFLRGFTLFELLAVITIIGIVLAVTLGSFTGWSDAHAVRGSADVVEAALNQARDYAAAHRTPVSFRYETYSYSTNGIKATAAFTLETFRDNQPIGAEFQRLPGNAWIIPDPSAPSASSQNFYGHYVFFPNGSVSNAVSGQTFRFFVVSRKMRDAAGTPQIAYEILIDPATGTATAERYDH